MAALRPLPPIPANARLLQTGRDAAGNFRQRGVESERSCLLRFDQQSGLSSPEGESSIISDYGVARNCLLNLPVRSVDKPKPDSDTVSFVGVRDSAAPTKSL